MRRFIEECKRLWHLLAREERREVVWLVVFMLVAMVFETLSIGMIVPTLGLFAGNTDSHAAALLGRGIAAMGHPSQATVVLLGLLLLSSCYIVKTFFLAFLAWKKSRFTNHVEVHLSQQFFALYLSQPYVFHLERNSAQLVNAVSTEVNIVAQFAVGPAFTLLAEVLVLAAVGVLLLLIEPAGTIAIALIVLAVFWLFHELTYRYTDARAEEREFHTSRSLQHLQQGVGAVKEVILSGRHAEFLAQYHTHNERRADASRRYDTLREMPRLVVEMVGVCAIAGLAAYLLATGRTAAAIMPTLGLFAGATFRVLPSVSRILSGLQSLRFAAPSVRKLHNDFVALETSRPLRGADAPPAFQHEVRLEDVSFGYAAADGLALDDVSLTIRRGEAVGIIGASGAGKSTLVDVLLGLLQPRSGRVLVDGRDIDQDLRRWQDQLGYVPQSLYLTDDTVRRNIAFGVPDRDIDEDAVTRAVEAAQLERLVSSLPRGVETVVGEDGVRLSGGERQRIGIARALYHRPSLIVFDEATSALDQVTERDLMLVVQALKGNTTVVIVTHRPSTLQHCDRVYEIAGGRLRIRPG